MNKHASRQSLQSMISRAISGSMDKTASDKGATDRKVRELVSYEKKEHGHIPTPSEEEAEHDKTASARTDDDFVEKLAASVDWIASNLDKVDFPSRGVLEKAAEEAGSPVGPGKGPGALEVEKSIGGEQSHRKDSSKTHDASKSTAGSPLSAGGLPGGKTQMDNDMHEAPGGGSVEPSASYPDKGPFAATKHAMSPETAGSLAGLGIGVGTQVAGYGIGKHYGRQQAERGEQYSFGAPQLAGAMLAPGGIGYQVGRHSAHQSHQRHQQKANEKHASPIARFIMRKLAGEDVMKANIDGGGTSSPLAGMGQLTTTDATQSSPSQSGDPGSGYGNQGRRLIQSNQAVIDATKGDAKGPQKTQLKEVLEEPALTTSTDSVLEENLRNTGKAGVKIAGARATLEKIAAAGCTCTNINGGCPFCRTSAKLAAAIKGRESRKHANAMMGMGGGGGGGMGGGMPSQPMTSMADAGAGADGCICGGAGECKICKLKAALAAMKAQGAGGMPDGGVPVEKDSTMGMGASPPGGIY